MSTRLSKPGLLDVGRQAVRLAKMYGSRDYHKEMSLDGMLLGLMDAKYGGITRQHGVWIGKSKKRIDFRQGGSRPVLIEFAVGTPTQSQVYGSQNRPELLKLERQKNSVASLRCLLLLDLSNSDAILRENLQSTFSSQPSGRGKYTRYPVWVFYVHPDDAYWFRWRSA